MGDNGDEWEFQRIGTESEKQSTEKEIAELRSQLEKVEEWRARKEEIDAELNKVWTEGSGELDAPDYLSAGNQKKEEDVRDGNEDAVESEEERDEENEEAVESEGERETVGGTEEGSLIEIDTEESPSWHPALRTP